MKTKAEILESHCPFKNVTGNTEYFTQDVINAMDEYAQQIAQEFAEWLVINGKPVSKFGLIDYWKLKSYQSKDKFTTSDLFAKFMAERNQITCPSCGSTRVLDWPDKYQCRRCEHTWER